MEQSRHLFLYCEDEQHRAEYLKSLESAYPIKTNVTSPMAIYIDDYSLPIIKRKVPIDKHSLAPMFARDYLHFTIAEKIVDKVQRECMQTLVNGSIEELLRTINDCYRIPQNAKISSLAELLIALKKARQFYSECYKRDAYGEKFPRLDDLQIAYLEI